LVELSASGELGWHILATLSRVGAGIGPEVLAGTVFGAICGYWSLARHLLDLWADTKPTLVLVSMKPWCWRIASW
jgi:ABC-type nitrate/sulfonate/bicarbonate transport system permease component